MDQALIPFSFQSLPDLGQNDACCFRPGQGILDRLQVGLPFQVQKRVITGFPQGYFFGQASREFIQPAAPLPTRAEPREEMLAQSPARPVYSTRVRHGREAPLSRKKNMANATA